MNTSPNPPAVNSTAAPVRVVLIPETLAATAYRKLRAAREIGQSFKDLDEFISAVLTEALKTPLEKAQ